MANSTGTSHSPQGLECPTPKVAWEALRLFFFSPWHSAENIKTYFSFSHHRGNPLNDDRERNIPSHCPYDTILLSSRHCSGQRIKHGFQQVDDAEGHRQPNAEVTRGGRAGSHSKLSHLWSLLISQRLNLWVLQRVITACMHMCYNESIWRFRGLVLSQLEAHT